MNCITVLVTNRFFFSKFLTEYGAIGINSTMNMTNYECVVLHYGSNTPALNILPLRFSGFLFWICQDTKVFYTS